MTHRVGAATLMAVLVAGASLALTQPVRADLHGGLTDTVEETVDTTVEVVDETVNQTEGTLAGTVEDAEAILTGTTTTTAIATTTATTTTTTTSPASSPPTTAGGTGTSDDAFLAGDADGAASGEGEDESEGAGLGIGGGQSPDSGSSDDQIPSRLDRLSVLATAGGLGDFSVSEPTATRSSIDTSLYGRMLDWLSGTGSGLGVLAAPLLGLEILFRALLSAGSGLVAPISLLAAFVARSLVAGRERRNGPMREAFSGG